MDKKYFEFIKNAIEKNNLIVFLKGSKSAPMCGFSYEVVRILNELELDFECINVMEDDNLRQAIKEYNDWPTIPQVFYKKEFVGGCDIIREMYNDGSLKNLLKNS